MDELMNTLSAEGVTASEKEQRESFFITLARELTPEGTLKALLTKTQKQKEMYKVLHVKWDYGQYELIRATGYTLVNSSLNKQQRYQLIGALGHWERFLLRISPYSGLLEELLSYYEAWEKELGELVEKKENQEESEELGPENKE